MASEDTIRASFEKLEKVHSWKVEELTDFFHVDPSVGYSDDQAAKQREKFGKNEFPPDEGTPLWKLVLEQFQDTLVIILICAALVSLFLAFFEDDEDERMTAFVEPLVIVLILVANATVGVLQESSAEAAVEALKAYESPHAVVLRNGVLKTVEAAELVPGDIVEIAVGDLVPADIRVIEKHSSTIKVAQGLLTGESESVSKDIAPVKEKAQVQDKVNTLFAGTSMERGKCRGIVVGTGVFTEKGKIRDQLQSTETEDTPLKKKLDEFGNQLSKAIFVVCIIVWVINIGHFSDPAFGGVWRGAIYYFKIAVSLAVAAIPEGLPAVVTTCLALGTQRMAAKNAIVTKLPAVETLGCTTVICSDKTGTLTTNQMSVLQFFVLGDDPHKMIDMSVEGDTYAPTRDDGTPFDVCNTATGKRVAAPCVQPSIAKFSAISSICNDSSIALREGKYEKIGQSTEAALKVVTEKLGLPDEKDNKKLDKMSPEERVQACNGYWNSKFTKDFTCEFTRDRKSMSVLVTDKSTQQRELFVKGAWDNVLGRCNRVMLSDGSIVSMDKKIMNEINMKVRGYCTGSNHYRCLALAYKDGLSANIEDDIRNAVPEDFVNFEDDLVFVGVAGILDPPRIEVKDAITKCKTAGIDVIVITGDNKATATAICRKIGVFGEKENVEGKAFEGAEFKQMSDKERFEVVKHARLFARVEPVDKKDLVDILHRHKKIVAMTGDGVNDAPALKAADIGLAMGSGTAVAKGASEMVLADDNFTTIVAAVEEGRNIYNNTKQFIRYLITANIGEVVAIFIAAVVGLPEMLLPVQLLWVNLVTDGLPAVALGFNPGEEGIMQQKPRAHDEPIISRFTLGRYVITGIYVGVATVLGMLWWFCVYEDGPELEYNQLFEWARCTEETVLPEGVDCDVFEDHSPGTVSLSILVTIEMLCALNSVSERHSMFSKHGNPLRNLYLLGAMAISFGLHFVILYVPFLQRIFQVEPLNDIEWLVVFLLSFPVILVDEVFKYILRVQDARRVKRLMQEQAS